MTTVPEQLLRQILDRHYRDLRLRLIARHALRAAAAAAAAIAAAVALGLALPSEPVTAWARAIAALLAAAAGLALALAAFRRALPGFDRHLDQVEERYPGVRSWLRNALDLEAHPAPHTSSE